MANNFCPNCGKPLKADAKFCGNCGAKLINDSVANIAPQAQSSNSNIPDIAPANTPANTTPMEPTTSTKNSIDNAVNTFNNSEKVNEAKSKFFSSEGRLNRMPYFLRGLVIWAIAIIGGTLSATGILAIIGVPILIACAVANIMLTIRRCHDLNKTGWLTVLMFIPYIGVIPGLYFLLAKGTTGPNKYGPDPLQY